MPTARRQRRVRATSTSPFRPRFCLPTCGQPTCGGPGRARVTCASTFTVLRSGSCGSSSPLIRCAAPARRSCRYTSTSSAVRVSSLRFFSKLCSRPCRPTARTLVSRTKNAGAIPVTDTNGPQRSVIEPPQFAGFAAGNTRARSLPVFAARAGHRRGSYPRARRFDSVSCDRSASGEAMTSRPGPARSPFVRANERRVRLPPLRPML